MEGPRRGLGPAGAGVTAMRQELKAMAISAADRKQVIEQYQRGEGDTGSPEVQVALLTQRINHLTDHFKEHSHDHHSHRPVTAQNWNTRPLKPMMVAGMANQMMPI